MVRLLAMAVAMFPLIVGQWIAMRLLPRDVLDAYLGFLLVPPALIYGVGFIVLYPAFLSRFRPAGEADRVRAYLESQGLQVVSLIPYGAQAGGWSSSDYRLYRARVRAPDGSEDSHTLGVAPTLFGDGHIEDRPHPKRRGLADYADPDFAPPEQI